jgi:hypothetical protein
MFDSDFAAPPTTDPLAYRGGPRTATYPAADGAAFPEGWSLGEWVVDFEDTPLYDLYEDHVSKGMELVTLVTDYYANRGTGKTTAAIKLGYEFDRTDAGLVAGKATNSPEEFIDAYVEFPKGAALVNDEAQHGVNARDAMTTVNKEMNEKVSMGRVGEKYSVWTFPDLSQIDKQVRKMAHVWVIVTALGTARVYELSQDPFEDKVYTDPLCKLRWGALPDDDPVYQKLDKQKWDTLTDSGDQHITLTEHRDRLEQEREDARKTARNEFITQAYTNDLLSQPELESITDVTQSTISRIISEGATA